MQITLITHQLLDAASQLAVRLSEREHATVMLLELDELATRQPLDPAHLASVRVDVYTISPEALPAVLQTAQEALFDHILVLASPDETTKVIETIEAHTSRRARSVLNLPELEAWADET